MSGGLRIVALVALLLVLAGGPISMSLWSTEPPPPATAATAEPFPAVIQTQIDGRREHLKLTGIAARKKLGIVFYRIGGYCDTDMQPDTVDEIVAADVPKRLVLVMERDVPDWVLRKGFEDAFNANDPDGRFPKQIQTLLEHVSSRPLKKGDRVVLTHLPRRGVECEVTGQKSIQVADHAFSTVVWNVYMGPRSVSPDLRKGLGSQLAQD